MDLELEQKIGLELVKLSIAEHSLEMYDFMKNGILLNDKICCRFLSEEEFLIDMYQKLSHFEFFQDVQFNNQNLNLKDQVLIRKKMLSLIDDIIGTKKEFRKKTSENIFNLLVRADSNIKEVNVNFRFFGAEKGFKFLLKISFKSRSIEVKEVFMTYEGLELGLAKHFENLKGLVL